MQRRAYMQTSRMLPPNPGPAGYTAVLVIAGNRAIRARLVSDLKCTGYIAYGVVGPAEALRLVGGVGHLDVVLCDTTASSADRVTRLAAQILAIRPTLKVIGLFRWGGAVHGRRSPAARRLWLEGLIEAVLGRG